MKDIIKKLKKQGIKVEGELHDFWFKHEDECTAAINRYGNPLAQKTICILRWRTPLGQLLRQVVLDFIETKQKEHKRYIEEKWRQNLIVEDYLCHIDFNELTFDYNEKLYPFNTVLDQITCKAGQEIGRADLRGINLEKVIFSNNSLSNACFAYANFKHANLQMVRLKSIYFQCCNFEQARLICLQGKVTLSDANLTRCIINATELNAHFFGRNAKIKKISYINLLLRFFYTPKERLETEFSNNEITISGGVEERSVLEYAYWYENTIRMIENTPWRKGKIKLFLSCLFTKNWSSILTVLCWDLLFILFFASCFFFLPENFNCLNPDVINGLNSDTIQGIAQEIIGAIYFSVVTFTTLGYGDLVPITSLGRVFVTAEVLIGYLFLGISAILVGKKIKV